MHLRNKYALLKRMYPLISVTFLLAIPGYKASNETYRYHSSYSSVYFEIGELTVNGQELNFAPLIIDLKSEVGSFRQRPFQILKFLQQRTAPNKKLIAAVLAFPFPFGIIGLHRIYLGTAPHVPVVYIGTLGGVLGILPLIDFVAILIEKDIQRYIWNKQVFMWVK